VNVLIVPDKFKGTLSARAAAEAIARGWRQARPGDFLTSLPMSDGGDGFGDVMGHLLHAKLQRTKTVDAAHRPCVAHWWWEPKTKTAVIESASVIGLAKLPPGQFHPFQLDTFGLGAVIRAAARKGAKRCIIGIGGSATNDGGFGLARALGWKFHDHDGALIEQWTDLDGLARISLPTRRRWFQELIVAVDVQNPLLGVHGATRVYGPQKGLRPEDFSVAEKCLKRLSVICKQKLGRSLSHRPGAGAAGGLGFGLMTFLGAKAEPGFGLFARFARLSEHLRTADLVITGEGCIDESSFMGKGVGEIVRRCRKRNVPCVALAGKIKSSPAVDQFFAKARSLTKFAGANNAQRRPAQTLERLAERMARQAKA